MSPRRTAAALAAAAVLSVSACSATTTTTTTTTTSRSTAAAAAATNAASAEQALSTMTPEQAAKLDPRVTDPAYQPFTPSTDEAARIGAVSKRIASADSNTRSSGTDSTGRSAADQARYDAAVAALKGSGCTNTTTGFTPTRLLVHRLGKAYKVIEVGTSSDGTIGSPANTLAWTAGWYDQSAKAAAPTGRSVVTVHSWGRAPAIGNLLKRADLRPGDVIELSDTSAHRACYVFDRHEQVALKAYNPKTTPLVEPGARPSMVIITCDGYEPRTRRWPDRSFYFADLVR